MEDPSQIIALMKTKAKTLDQMTRRQLVGFIRTVLNLRDAFVEEGIEAGKGVMMVSLWSPSFPPSLPLIKLVKEMAQAVLTHLGRPTINWSELADWEAKMFRQLVREVEGIPVFLARILDTILAQTVSTANTARGSSSNENMEINWVETKKIKEFS